MRDDVHRGCTHGTFNPRNIRRSVDRWTVWPGTVSTRPSSLSFLFPGKVRSAAPTLSVTSLPSGSRVRPTVDDQIWPTSPLLRSDQNRKDANTFIPRTHLKIDYTSCRSYKESNRHPTRCRGPFTRPLSDPREGSCTGSGRTAPSSPTTSQTGVLHYSSRVPEGLDGSRFLTPP